ncbi:LLM class flavin-dependent oxidoreductase [Gordonia sp. ABSL11-1]|uniref:LLM class flavin-dependent oxidoreductase n=1 Tax=Gordonia sp. ABSL11-1 TaxID=3053924 RepID=UPI002573E41A|nr:LLM class flavin-dependent oxidoreductase [Gordonia sp. ABSL11-1]MDL9948126.1 LLM class flavin-dependent oxidoreductase [Gordonia sp. ABSL11-1]
MNYNPGLGAHPARWRVVDDPRQFWDINTYIKIAQVAERGTFDAVFLSDTPSLRETVPTHPWHTLDPIDALTAIAVSTDRIGLIATVSTTYNEPYNLARRFSTLDHISHGRAGWNIVTTWNQNAASNFGVDAPDHDTRYGRADEFVDLVTKLWDSWEDDAFVGDQSGGVFIDPAKVHAVEHIGTYFKSRGPLQLPPSPQRHPVLIQAGASELGRTFASKHADIVYTIRHTVGDGQDFYADIKSRVATQGRDPEKVFVLSGVYPVVGSTEQEAREHLAQLDQYIDLDASLAQLSERIQLPLSRADLDKRPPARPSGWDQANISHGLTDAAWQALEKNKDLTLREILLGHRTSIRHLVGTPEQIADDLELWFRSGASDGFNVSATHFPEGIERFVDHVVPELRKRGLLRDEYEGSTFRDHLGLAVPESQYTSAHV